MTFNRFLYDAVFVISAIQGFHSAALGTVIGPSKAFGSHLMCILWAYLRLSLGSSQSRDGPIQGLWQSYYFVGPSKSFGRYLICILWAHTRVSLRTVVGPSDEAFNKHLICGFRQIIPTLITNTSIYFMVAIRL